MAARMPIRDATHDAAAARKYQPGRRRRRAAADRARHVREESLATGAVDLDSKAVGQAGAGVRIAIAGLVGMIGEVRARAGDGVPNRCAGMTGASSLAIRARFAGLVAELLPELGPPSLSGRTRTLTFGAPRSRRPCSICSTSLRATPARRWLVAVATW